MISKAQLLFAASRPFSWVNTAFPFAAAYLLAGGSPHLFFVLGVIYFLFPFNLLMYGVNDVYDYDSDIRNPRKGGVEGAKIAKRYHRFVLTAAGLITAPFAIYFMTAPGPLAGTVFALLIIDAVAYSAPPLRLKERPILDSISSSLHFTGPALFGLLAAGVNQAFVPALVALFVWGLASHAFGAIQDIRPDREAGISSIATVFGRNLTTLICVVLFTVAAALPAWYGTLGLVLSLVLLAYPVLVVWSWRTDRYNRGWRVWMWLNLGVGFVFTQLVLWSRLLS